MDNNRKKAQDVFNETNFVFAQKTTFEKAFPEISKINLEVDETGKGVYHGLGHSYYGKHNIGEYVNCSNPSCYNGGFRIGEVIRNLYYKKDTNFEGSAFCQGKEGSPKGRRIYGTCYNRFTYKVEIEYNEKEDSETSANSL